ncbi:MAG: tyrosine-type recombinase/integrase [Elusimicrobiota bacterium]|jgi:integrase/recombinase XerD
MAKTTVGRCLRQHEITQEQASEAFHLRCQARGLSPNTWVWYSELLKYWRRFLEDQGVRLPKDVTPHIIRLYLEQLRSRNICANSRARTYGGLRCIFSFLVREGMLPQNPFLLVEKPRMEKKLLKPMSLDHVRKLLAAINTKRWTDQNLRTAIILLMDTGLRVSELIGLRKDQLDFPAGVLRVMGKGGKEREVPFGVAAKQALLSYAARRGEVPGQDLFFVNRYGRKLCRYWIEKALRNLGRAAEVQGVRVSPHTLRHTFATQYIKNGGDAFSLQKILGHSTLDMVRVYVGLADADVAALHRKFSPMDRMGLVPGGKRRVVVQ